MRILTIDNKKDTKFLKKKTKGFDFSKWNQEDIDALIDDMKATMRDAHGIGLAANQVGLPYRMFVAEIDTDQGKKFYAIFNPELEHKGKETALFEEGCLSVPEQYGEVERYTNVVLRGQDRKGKQLKIKAWGLLAHVFQHEVDHLDGTLFVSRALKLYTSPSSTPFVFFGTPRFAALVLETLSAQGLAPHTVITNPDKPVGRKQTLTAPPAKIVAEAHGIKVIQPNRARDVLSLIPSPRVSVVAAYAHILPKEVIEFPRLGTIGIHPSLLPRHRGPSPIQAAILEGDKETGVTLYLIDKEVDHGDVLAQATYKMSGKETYEELEEALARLGSELLVTTLPKFMKGEIVPKPQNHTKATFTKKFTTDDGFVEPDDLEDALRGNKEKAGVIDRKIRALNPEPGVWTLMGPKEERIKLLKAHTEHDSLILDLIQRAGKTPALPSTLPYFS